jgi:hypothetical protein
MMAGSALIEEKDIDRVITEIWADWTLAEVEWEGITYQDGIMAGHLSLGQRKRLRHS